MLAPGQLTIAVNTGDDFEHLGLAICPDIDSVVYALAGLNDSVRGWGVVDESWRMMERLAALGEAEWFNLGDRDLAMHVARSWRLRSGESLSEVTARLTAALGIFHRVVPMSDAPVRTQIETADGWLDFQQYFVREQCRPMAKAIRFAGTPGAAPSAGFAEALARVDLAAIVLCPSNPFLSVDPILAVDGVRDALAARKVPLVAVSPLVGGTALKGPLAKLLGELGQPCDNRAIAGHYAGLVDHLLIDNCDAADAEGLRALGVCANITATVMCTAEDRKGLARVALSAAGIELG